MEFAGQKNPELKSPEKVSIIKKHNWIYCKKKTNTLNTNKKIKTGGVYTDLITRIQMKSLNMNQRSRLFQEESSTTVKHTEQKLQSQI